MNTKEINTCQDCFRVPVYSVYLLFYISKISDTLTLKVIKSIHFYFSHRRNNHLTCIRYDIVITKLDGLKKLPERFDSIVFPTDSQKLIFLPEADYIRGKPHVPP